MSNRFRMNHAGLLSAIALCGTLSFVACSSSDDDTTSDDASADGSAPDGATDAKAADAKADASGDAARADAEASTDARAEATSDANFVVDTGTDARSDAAAEATIDAALDVTAAPVDGGVEAAVDSGLVAVPDSGSPAVDAAIDVSVTVPDSGQPQPDARADAAETAVDAGSEAEAAAPYVPPADGGPAVVRFTFDTSDEDWTTNASDTDPTPPIAVALSTTQHDTGAGSLQVTLNNSVSSEINNYITNMPGLERGTFTFRMLVPAATNLTFMKAWQKTGPGTDYYFDSSGVELQSRDVWHTYTVNFTFPAGYDGEEIEQLGFQFEGTGTVYIDNVSW